MSPSNINSFVGDLVQMAKAMETLPEVQAELDEAYVHNSTLTNQINSICADLEQSRNYAASLEQKVRSLEVERDDASFRVLEAEDAAHSVLTLVRTASVDLAIVIQKLDPPKPEPMKEPEPQAQPVATPAEGQSEVDPTTAQAPAENSSTNVSYMDVKESSLTDWEQDKAETSLIKPIPEAVSSISDLGQSESSPTVDSVSGSLPVDKQENVFDRPATDPTPGPYFNKRYIDAPVYISYYDWLEGGGTHDDYYAGRI